MLPQAGRLCYFYRMNAVTTNGERQAVNVKLPEITALQFAALSLLMAGEKTGRQLRRELSQWDGPASSAGFSQG